VGKESRFERGGRSSTETPPSSSDNEKPRIAPGVRDEALRKWGSDMVFKDDLLGGIWKERGLHREKVGFSGEPAAPVEGKNAINRGVLLDEKKEERSLLRRIRKLVCRKRNTFAEGESRRARPAVKCIETKERNCANDSEKIGYRGKGDQEGREEGNERENKNSKKEEEKIERFF